MAIIKKHKACVGKDANWNSWWGWKMVWPLRKPARSFLKTLAVELAWDPATPSLECVSERTAVGISRDISAAMSLLARSTKSRGGSTGRRIKPWAVVLNAFSWWPSWPSPWLTWSLSLLCPKGGVPTAMRASAPQLDAFAPTGTWLQSGPAGRCQKWFCKDCFILQSWCLMVQNSPFPTLRLSSGCLTFRSTPLTRSWSSTPGTQKPSHIALPAPAPSPGLRPFPLHLCSRSGIPLVSRFILS